MEPNAPSLDYLTPDVSELASHRIGVRVNEATQPHATHAPVTRGMAKRLIPACVVVPALLWWLAVAGTNHGLYSLKACFALYEVSVTLALLLVVCLSLKRLSRMDDQRAQAQEQLKLAKDAAEAANRFRSLFFANISHEIRTPLTAINGFAELLLNPDRTTEQRIADARVIRRNGEHLLTLINDILDLSKIEAGKMSVDRTSCAPAKIVGEVCAMLRHRAGEKGLELNLRFEGLITTMIKTDPTRLRQILINLLANAIKFTSEGSVQVTVSIIPNLHDNRPLLQVKIADTGIGIPPEQQATLFQAFVQGDTTITRRYGGSGLGLAISKHFARALGGDITLVSRQGHGSTFTVTVETDLLVGVPLEESPETATEGPDSFNMPRMRINGTVLVAEDGLDNQALIAEKLRSTGLTVQIAPNGRIACDKALHALKNGMPFSLILMDVQMPVMDGFAATLELRSKGYRGPIIALTANAMERDRQKCLSAGCNDFVTKPIQMPKLLSAIGRYLKVATVVAEPATAKDAIAVPEPVNPAEKFYQELPADLDQIEEAIQRQDRERLREIAQLLLGKTTTAGLRDVAPSAAKLLQSTLGENSWVNLLQAVGEFVSDARSASDRRAA